MSTKSNLKYSFLYSVFTAFSDNHASFLILYRKVDKQLFHKDLVAMNLALLLSWQEADTTKKFSHCFIKIHWSTWHYEWISYLFALVIRNIGPLSYIDVPNTGTLVYNIKNNYVH